MRDYSEHRRKHRRLSCLIGLAGSEQRRASDSELWEIVSDFVPSTRDQIRTELLWLRDNGFVTLREIATILMATITEAGADMAAGRRTDPRIATPSPRAE